MQTFEKTQFCMGTRKMVETGWNKILFLWSCCSAVSLNVASLAPPAPWCKNIRRVIVSYVINLWGSFIKEKSFNTHLLSRLLLRVKGKKSQLYARGMGEEDTSQPIFHQRDCLKMKYQMLDEHPFLPTGEWSANICCKLCEERATKLLKRW